MAVTGAEHGATGVTAVMVSLGDRTMGIWEKMPEKFLAALDSRFGIVSPREHGVDTVDAIRAMRDGRANRSGVDQAEPQSRGPRRHCVDPAVTGPHRPRHPRWGETTGVGGRFDVHGSSVARQPAPAQRSGAQRGRHRLPAGPHPARPGHPVPWERFAGGYDAIRDAIAAVVPGCDDYNRKVRAPDGFQLLHGPRDSREFPTSTGKANFSANPLGWVPVPEGRLVLQTLSSHDQYNTTIYGLDDRYRGVKGGRRVVLVNPADVERFGLSEGDRVDLVSEFTNSDGHMHERRAKDFMVGRLLHTGRQRCSLLSGDQTPCAAGSHRHEVEYAGVEGHRHQAGAHLVGRVTARRRVQHVTADDAVARPETLVVEEPLEIRVNGTPITVTMRTPGSDIELAQGFLLTEGVVTCRDDVLTVRYCKGASEDGVNTYNVLDVTLAPDVPAPDVDVTRNFYTTSSCGICGKASLDAVRTDQPPLPRRRPVDGGR